MYIYIYIYLSIYLSISLSLNIYIYIYIYISLSLYLSLSIYIYTYITHLYLSLSLYIYIYIYLGAARVEGSGRRGRRVPLRQQRPLFETAPRHFFCPYSRSSEKGCLDSFIETHFSMLVLAALAFDTAHVSW